MTDITIDTHDHDGAFGVVAEWRTQGPILMEAEGPKTGRKAAEDLQAHLHKNGNVLRTCIVRLVPVEGNELLFLDLQRMQK